MNHRLGLVWPAVRRAIDGLGVVAGAPARVADIGGGTGGFAVPLAELGHQVLVVDPNPDALAALGRRAAEAGVTDRVAAVQGVVEDLALITETSGADFDLVLCHEVLEVLPDPGAGLRTIAAILRPGGVLSVVVPGLHATVVAKVMAGQFQQALALLEVDGRADRAAIRGGRRFTPELIVGLIDDAGLSTSSIHAARVFTDLVPGALIDTEPGAHQALAELERAVFERPEYLALATHLHLLATR
ncbi:MAG: class I SAM-dependent methyltransferase [Nocardioides sp.]